MSPREEILADGVSLHCGDAVATMRSLPAGSVDLVLTDPPFFAPATHYQSRVEWGRKWADMSILEQWWGLQSDEIRRVLKPEGHALVFCNADSYPAFYPAMFSRWDKLVALVWDKERPGLGRIWRHQHEFIIAGRNKGAYEPNDGRLRRDVLRHKATLSRERTHPVEKPTDLLAELIEASCPPGGLVLDPFAGSGTTGEAALRQGRRSIMVEREEAYQLCIRRRIQSIAPGSLPDLFISPPQPPAKQEALAL